MAENQEPVHMQPDASKVDIGFSEVSKKWMIAALGAIPVSLQSVSYLYYKAFFSEFRVRPDEVGYDFSALLGRQAAATILASAMCLLALALITALFVYVLYPISLISFGRLIVPRCVKSRFPALSKLEGDIIDLRIVAVLFMSLLVSASIVKFSGGALRFLQIPAVGFVFALDHLASRRRGKGVSSAWDRFTAPRSYGVGRVFAILVACSLILSFPLGPVGSLPWLNSVAFGVVCVVLFDRALSPPWLEFSDMVPPPKMRPALVFSLISILGAAGIFAMGVMDKVADIPAVRHAITQTVVGNGYIGGAFDWKSIVVPDTYPVSVFWSSTSPPPSILSKENSQSAVLLGQANGVTVLWLPREGKPMRIPSASVSMVSR